MDDFELPELHVPGIVFRRVVNALCSHLTVLFGQKHAPRMMQERS